MWVGQLGQGQGQGQGQSHSFPLGLKLIKFEIKEIKKKKKKNAFENVIWKISAILSKSQYVNCPGPQLLVHYSVEE